MIIIYLSYHAPIEQLHWTTLLRRVKAVGSIRTLLIVEDIAGIRNTMEETCRYVFVTLFLLII